MFLLINKPVNMTSHDVIDYVRAISGEKKVGHAGTLDPSATGLLIVGISRESTKKLGLISKGTKKTYKAGILLGETRDTDDLEGNIISRSKFKPKSEIVRSVVKSFLGKSNQIPPKYAAIKLKGKRAYKLARAGKLENILMTPKNIEIYSIKLVEYKYPNLSIETTVSAGTYIRALARDIGLQLECGAYLNSLVRTDIGKYSIKNAVSLDRLNEDNWRRFAVSIDL